jgi:hypothetical protein
MSTGHPRPQRSPSLRSSIAPTMEIAPPPRMMTLSTPTALNWCRSWPASHRRSSRRRRSTCYLCKLVFFCCCSKLFKVLIKLFFMKIWVLNCYWSWLWFLLQFFLQYQKLRLLGRACTWPTPRRPSMRPSSFDWGDHTVWNLGSVATPGRLVDIVCQCSQCDVPGLPNGARSRRKSLCIMMD